MSIRPLRPTRRVHLACWLTLALVGLLNPARAADPGRTADELLGLVPPDASLVVTVEGLRDRYRGLVDSRLIADLRRLPAVRSWLESEEYRHMERSFREVEAALGVKLADVRDGVLGDAVVLVLRLPDGDRPDPGQARGMLLLKARDPGLLSRLVSAINDSQRRSGELKRVDTRRRRATPYSVREFPEGSGRPPEWFVGYPDGTFAFSNSEDLIRDVVDRKPWTQPGMGPAGSDVLATKPGLGESPRCLAVRRRLPTHPMARIFLDPRAVERLLAPPPGPAKPTDDRAQALLRRHLAAVDYAGAALIWRSDAIVVHAVATIARDRVDGWLRHWAADPRKSREELRRVPKTALALVSAHVDLTSLREAIYGVVPAEDHQRLRNFEMILTGLLLGRDVGQLLSVLGPGVIVYLDAPAEPTESKDSTPGARTGRGRLFPMVMVVDLAADSGGKSPRPDRDGPPFPAVADAIENALRTLLILVAMDEKHGRGRGSIATTPVAGASVQTLSVPIPFAFAIDRAGGRLVLGTSALSVARYLESASDPGSGARFRDWRAAAFADDETFACVDLDALTGLADRYRDRLARYLAARQHRPIKDVEGDLEHVLALARLFRAAFLAGRIEPDASALQGCVGVILKDSPGGPAARP